MSMIKVRSLLMLLAMLVVPVALVAQQPAPMPEPTPEVQGWIVEIQQIEQQLGTIQARAMEDPALQRAHSELNEAVIAALRAAGPETAADLRRVETIQPEIQAAQEAGDQEQLQRLVTEAQQLQERLAQAQMRVLEQPQIATQAEAFQTHLQARMVEVEPEAESLLQRFAALQAQILAAMQGGQPGN